MITCPQLTELVSPYVEGTLDEADRATLEQHLHECDACRDHLSQLETTVEVCGHVEAEVLTPDARERLAVTFRAWATERRR